MHQTSPKKSCLDMQHSHSEGSDLAGSNATDAEDDADPSKEAEDSSCCVRLTGVSVVGVSGEVLATSVRMQEARNQC